MIIQQSVIKVCNDWSPTTQITFSDWDDGDYSFSDLAERFNNIDYDSKFYINKIVTGELVCTLSTPT